MKNISKYLIAAAAFLGIIILTITIFQILQNQKIEYPEPIEDFAYEWSAEISYEPTEIPLIGNWVLVSNDVSSNLSYFDFMSVGKDEIWFTIPLQKYTPSTGELEEYKLTNQQGQDIEVQSIIVTNKNEVWGLGRIFYEGLYIFHYDRESDSFKLLEDSDGDFSEYFSGGRNNFVEDSNEQLWFIYEGGLYKLDPQTEQIDFIVGEEQSFEYLSSQLVITSTDEIWAPAIADEWPKDIYLGYNIQTGHFRTALRLTDKMMLVDQIFIDYLDRVWIANFGWIETRSEKPDVYKLIENSIFLTDHYAYGIDLQYRWAHPRARLETENRYLWFIEEHGIYQLDVEKEEWVLLSTENISDIGVDSDGTVWLLKEDGLYKLDN